LREDRANLGTAGNGETEFELTVALARLEVAFGSHAPAVGETLGLVDTEEEAALIHMLLIVRLLKRLVGVVILVGVERGVPATLAIRFEIEVKRGEVEVSCDRELAADRREVAQVRSQTAPSA
jgi:hypothetical protein